MPARLLNQSGSRLQHHDMRKPVYHCTFSLEGLGVAVFLKKEKHCNFSCFGIPKPAKRFLVACFAQDCLVLHIMQNHSLC